MAISKRQATPASSLTTVLRPLTRLFNPLILNVAGRRGLPIFAVIQHRGRRTARSFKTPVAVRPEGDFLVFPLTFGAEAGWCRNLLAAGGGSVRWKGADHALSEPEVIDGAIVLGPGSPYPWLFRMAAIHVFRIRLFLRARYRGASA